ncbi:hypothetical protein PCL1606_05800 [Pseudomonas chlororaphis]|uniref:Uncharacterized protein n=1 Tax=Pseudomonas chlororaphis TaxID=587753 RepID=A0A0D5XT64_9PSED|nr:hypothetical protein PCL1606_05800 [Pseudomonas chlororaphis]
MAVLSTGDGTGGYTALAGARKKRARSWPERAPGLSAWR